MGNPCRCEICCPTSPEFTWSSEWRAWTEAAEVASWEPERRQRYYRLVEDSRGEAAALRLVGDVKAAIKDLAR